MKDLSHIKMVQITKECGWTETENVVLFNSNHVSCEDALFTVRNDLCSPNVLCISKAQWVEMFCNGIDEI